MGKGEGEVFRAIALARWCESLALHSSTRAKRAIAGPACCTGLSAWHAVLVQAHWPPLGPKVAAGHSRRD